MIEGISNLIWYLISGFFSAFFIVSIINLFSNNKDVSFFGFIIGFIIGVFIIFIIKLFFHIDIFEISSLSLNLLEEKNRSILIYYIILFFLGLVFHKKILVLFSILILAILPVLIIDFFYPIVISSSFLSYIVIIGLAIVGIIGLIMIIRANKRNLFIYGGLILMGCGFFLTYYLFINVLLPNTSVAQSLIYYSFTILMIVGIKKKDKNFNVNMCLNPTAFTDKRCILYLNIKCKITPDDEICQKYKHEK